MMSLRNFSRAIGRAVRDVDSKHLLAFSGSLAYYYFLALLPLLILLASALAYVPIPHLFDQVLLWMSYFIPPDSMTLVSKVFSDLMATRNSGFLSFGIIGTIWTASGASAAMIEALNVAYGVNEGRPFWRTRLLAVGLTFLLGILVAIVLAAMIMGPVLGAKLAHRMGIHPLFTQSWFYFRWVLAISFSTIAIEMVYYLAPNVEQRKFLRTVPGSFVAVATWIGASYAFGFYVEHVGMLSKSYGTLGAVAGLLLWFYLSSAAILIGAEVNAELLKAAREQLPVKEAPSAPNAAEPPVGVAGQSTRITG
jgi:membrane protein